MAPTEEECPSAAPPSASDAGTDSIQRGSEAGKSSTKSLDMANTSLSREESTREDAGAAARSDGGNSSSTTADDWV